MDRHHGTERSETETKRDRAKSQRDVVRLERPRRKRQSRILPYPGSDGRDRICSATAWRRRHQTYTHHLSRTHERLRQKVVDAMIASGRRGALLLLFCLLPTSLFAHRLDEYLQAMLVSIEPREIRIQINLTPGVAVAERVLAFIDRNRAGLISTNEAWAYAEMLKGDLRVQLDGRHVEFGIAEFNFPDVADLRTGSG